MQEKFTIPLTKEEFIKRAEPVSIPGAKATISGIDIKLKRAVGLLAEERKFFEDVIVYKQSGTLPERLQDEKTT